MLSHVLGTKLRRVASEEYLTAPLGGGISSRRSQSTNNLHQEPRCPSLRFGSIWVQVKTGRFHYLRQETLRKALHQACTADLVGLPDWRFSWHLVEHFPGLCTTLFATAKRCNLAALAAWCDAALPLPPGLQSGLDDEAVGGLQTMHAEWLEKVHRYAWKKLGFDSRVLDALIRQGHFTALDAAADALSSVPHCAALSEECQRHASWVRRHALSHDAPARALYADLVWQNCDDPARRLHLWDLWAGSRRSLAACKKAWSTAGDEARARLRLEWEWLETHRAGPMSRAKTEVAQWLINKLPADLQFPTWLSISRTVSSRAVRGLLDKGIAPLHGWNKTVEAVVPAHHPAPHAASSAADSYIELLKLVHEPLHASEINLLTIGQRERVLNAPEVEQITNLFEQVLTAGYLQHALNIWHHVGPLRSKLLPTRTVDSPPVLREPHLLEPLVKQLTRAPLAKAAWQRAWPVLFAVSALKQGRFSSAQKVICGIESNFDAAAWAMLAIACGCPTLVDIFLQHEKLTVENFFAALSSAGCANLTSDASIKLWQYLKEKNCLRRFSAAQADNIFNIIWLRKRGLAGLLKTGDIDKARAIFC